jgi:hypothetical protein
MSRRTRKAALGFAAVFFLLGCVSTSERLRSKFASEKTCPKEQVHVTEKGANVYQVTGCSESVEYVCSTFANTGGSLPCEEQGGIKNAPSGAPTRSPGMENHQRPPGPAY